DQSAPLDLAVFASYAHHDRANVTDICKFLGEQRSFDIWLDSKDVALRTLWQNEIEEGLADRLTRGGYVIAFWSHGASRSQYLERQIASAAAAAAGERINDRVLFARLDPSPLPDFWLRYQEPFVQIYGDAERPKTHRIDDLVVRLYWLIYRKTHSTEVGGREHQASQ